MRHKVLHSFLILILIGVSLEEDGIGDASNEKKPDGRGVSEVDEEDEDKATDEGSVFGMSTEERDLANAIKILAGADLSAADVSRWYAEGAGEEEEEDDSIAAKFAGKKNLWLEAVARGEESGEAALVEDEVLAQQDAEPTQPEEERELTAEEKQAAEVFGRATTLLEGSGPNRDEGYQLLGEAARLGHRQASVQLAWARLLGSGLPQDIPAALRTFQELAESGLPDAHMGLGFMYAAGIAVNASQARALVHYTFGAVGGSSWAQMALGYRYWSGVTVQSSCEKALDFYRKVANKVASGVTLSGGQAVQRARLLDEAENPGYNSGILDQDLMEYYQLLAEKGDMQAQVGLGQLHYQGARGVARDHRRALHYFQQAAGAGNAIATAFLGKIHLEQGENKTALEYFQRAADMGNPVGQSGLGLMHLHAGDYEKALKYFSQAAEQGWVDGQLQLGNMYFSGLGVARDYKVANKYFSLASQSGHVLAYYKLAQMHATGTGMMRSCPTATELFKNVAERGKWGEKMMEAHTHYREGRLDEAYVTYALLAELGYEVAQSNAAFLLDRGAGDLPSADTARSKYVPQIRQERKEFVCQMVKDQLVAVLCDETTDRNGRCVFVVLLRTLCPNQEQKMFVAGVKVLLNANAAECSRAILDVLTDYNVKYDNVVGIVTDSARYMTLCAQMCEVLCPDLLHIQCWAHKLNLVANIWSTKLPELNNCIANAKVAFLNTRKRKHKYISFLREKYPNEEKKCVLFPSPVMTRWNSWYKSALYIAEYLSDLVEYFKTTNDGGAAVQYFKDLTNIAVVHIIASAKFLSEHCQSVIETIVQLEGSSYPYAHKLQTKIQDLRDSFRSVAQGNFGEATNATLDTMTVTLKSVVAQQLQVLGVACERKLSLLLLENTPSAKPFFECMGKLFDIRNISINTVDDTLLNAAKNIPVIKKISSKLFLEGYSAFKRQVLSQLDSATSVDLVSVLLGLKEDHQEFAESCIKILWIPVSNVDSERAFSVYGNILTDMRTNLKPENMELMVSMYFGN